MTGPVRSIIFDLVGHDGVSSTFDKVAASAEKSATRMDAVTAKMTKTGAAITKSVTVPVAALAAFSIDQAAKFQSTMTLIQTAGGESAKKAAQISTGLKKIAVDTGTSLDQLGDAIYIVAKAGAAKWSAVEQLGVVKAAAEGAKSEHVDLTVATTALTSVMQSYGMKAKDAVQVENELIRGSGLAKTNFEEFSSSLANVVPLAASLHISFSQVAGAIDTMTQHGDTAQRATDDLNNLIRALAGQNNVASGAMQQLGINTVDLAKNLGTRGLTGTLAIVQKALESHIKNGLVVTDVHKAMALGTKSLTEMMSSFSGTLLANSKGLLDGSVSINEYRKYARSLGAQQGGQALQFLALSENVKGFNDQLKSGHGVATTSVDDMKKMLGGATGMNTALMLGVGTAKENAASQKLFGDSVASVAAAARQAGADVLGWAQTQDTMAVKVAQAKEALQVMAVEIGTELIPVVTKMAGWVMDAVNWWDHLSSGWKKTIGIAVGVAAALGPILTIGGRIAKLFSAGLGIAKWVADSARSFATFVTNGFQTTAQVEAQQARQALADQMAAAAITEAEAQKAEATATTAAEIAASLNGTDSVLAASARQAYWSAEEFATAMRAEADAAVQAAAEASAAMEEQAATIATTSSASKLAIAGIGVAAGTMAGEFTQHMSASGQAIGALAATATGAAAGFAMGGPLGAAIGGVTGLVSDLATKFFNSGDSAKKASAAAQQALADENASASTLLSTLQSINGAYDSNYRQKVIGQLDSKGALQVAQKGGIDLTKVVGAATGALNPMQMAGLNAQIENAAVAGKISMQQAAQLQQAITGVGGAALMAEQAYERQTKAAGNSILTSKQLGATMTTLRGVFKGMGTSLDTTTAVGARNTEVVKEEATALGTAAAAQLAHGKSAQAVAKNIADQTLALQDNLVKLGFSRDDVAALIVQYEHVPAKVATQLANNAPVVSTLIDDLIKKYDHIPPVKKTTITVDDAQALQALRDVQQQTQALHSLGVGIGGHLAAATGGVIVGPGTGTSDSIPAMLSNGEFVVNAAQTAKHLPLLRAINSGNGYAGGGVVGGMTYTTAAGYDNALVRVANALLSAGNSLLAAVAKLSNNEAAVKASVDKLATAAEKAGTAFPSVLSAQLLNDASARDRIVAELGSPPSVLRQTAYDKLGTATTNFNNARSSVASSTLGFFDITKAGQLYSDRNAGTASGILSSLTYDVGQTRQFYTTLESLHRLGLNGALLMQLAQAGPSALPQAQSLLSGGASIIRSINAEYGQLNRYANAVGAVSAQSMYGAGVSAAQGLVNGLLSQEKSLTSAMERLGQTIENTLKKQLGIHSPSRVMHELGVHTGQGYINGVRSTLGGVGAAGGDLATAVTGAAAGGNGGAGGVYVEMHNHFPPGLDESTTAAMVSRKLAERIA